MRKTLRTTLLLLLAIALVSLVPWSSDAQELPDKFQNLQVLDPEISKDDLKNVMEKFTAALGVKCSFCHTIDEYHLDDNKHKPMARDMIKLVIHMRSNAEMYFPEETEMDKVGCAMCHQGEAEIEEWSPEDDEDWP